MAKTPAKLDKETRKGMLLAAFLVAGTVAAAGAASYLWQANAKEEKSQERQARYLTLGEHRLTLGSNSMLIHLSVEYRGTDTGKALAKAQKRLEDGMLKILAQRYSSDLAPLRTPQGKKALADEVLDLVRDAVPAEHAGSVREVLYEQFLIGE